MKNHETPIYRILLGLYLMVLVPLLTILVINSSPESAHLNRLWIFVAGLSYVDLFILIVENGKVLLSNKKQRYLK